MLSTVSLDDTVEAMLGECASGTPTAQPKPARPLQDARSEIRPVISVIVPASESSADLLKVLDRLGEARGVFCRSHGKHAEVIVPGYGERCPQLLYAEEFDAKVVSRNFPTLSAAVNAGVAAARGTLLVLVGPDLLPSQECLCHIFKTLSDVNTLGGGTAVKSENHGLLSAIASLVWRIPLRLNGLSLGMFFVRKQSFDSLGGFEESILPGQMLEFALRLKKFAAASGKRLTNVKETCATSNNGAGITFSAKEWFKLLVLPLLWRC